MSALRRIEWRAMGTTCSAAVTARPHDVMGAQSALIAAREEVAACERELSRFDPASDLSRLNRAGGKWTRVGPRLLEALRLALEAREETEGRFDPTILPALTAAGYDRSFELLEERQAAPIQDWRARAAVELDLRLCDARLEPRSAVDLGGIGKGYAAGRALAAMLAVSPQQAGGVVDLGGDIAIRGEPPGGGSWLIAVSDPRRPGETLATLAMDAGGVATSGRDARRFGPGASLHHLIDPETGESALSGPLTVTVVAPSSVSAEFHATTLAIAGLGEAEAHVAARPSISALYVPHGGPPIQLGRLPLAPQRLLVSAA